MLKPERISLQSQEEVLKKISLIANKANLSKLDKEFLKLSSIYQYELPELPNNKIILTEKVYIRLCGLAAASNFFESYCDEYGCYLFGKDLGDNRVIFDTIGEKESKVSSKEFNTSEEMADEIVEKIENSEADCICHVHTHPNTEVNFSSTPSNQDLYVYAWFSEQFYGSQKDINYFGALITPTEDTKESFNDICFIFYDKKAKYFYKATNVFCVDKSGNLKKLEKERYEQVRNGIVESIENRVLLLKQYYD